MSTKKPITDFYFDGEKQVLVELDFGTIRWSVFSLIASYIHKLADKVRVVARGSDRVEVRGQIAILELLGAQLLEIAKAIEEGPPEEYKVQLITE